MSMDALYYMPVFEKLISSDRCRNECIAPSSQEWEKAHILSGSKNIFSAFKHQLHLLVLHQGK